MSSGLLIVLYLAAAAPCVVVVALLLRWARPVNGELSPRLRKPGMETLVVGTACLTAMAGLAFMIGAVLETFR